MKWFLFAILSALFLSASSLIEKKSLKRVHSIDLSVATGFVNLIFSIPFLFFIDWSNVNNASLLIIVGSSLLTSMAFYMIAKAMRHMEISVVSPFLALSPGTTAIAGFFLLNEILDKQGILGIFLMIVGSYILTLHPEHDLMHPFRIFKSSKYFKFIFISLILYSFAGVFDRAIIFNFGVPVANYMFFMSFFIAIWYFPILLFLGRGAKEISMGFKLEKKNIILSSLLTVLYRLFEMQALALAFVGLVSAIKRSSSFFITLVGGQLFHEKNLRRKLYASAIIIIGTVLIVL